MGQSSTSQRDCLLQSTQKLVMSSDLIKQFRPNVEDMEVRLYVPFHDRIGGLRYAAVAVCNCAAGR